MVVQAPFRFAPIHRRVWFPEWGPLVSHDVPFADGVSGEIPIAITAETPLLVGGPRRRPATGQPGEVWPVETVDRDGRRRYAIPGSSLQGLARWMLEIAAFGRLGPFVEDRRFGIRDISGSPTSREYYQNRMVNKVKSGWLIKHHDAHPMIVPCQLARIDFEQLCQLKGERAPEKNHVLLSRNDALQRYSWFLSPAGSLIGLDRQLALKPGTAHTMALVPTSGQDTVAATIVMTGKPVAGSGKGRKNLEFVFHSPDRLAAAAACPTAKSITKDVWEDFGLIHFEQPGRDENPNWTFWKNEFEAGRPVPVFYLEEGGRISTFGTAFMFKAAFRLSAHDLLRNSTHDHMLPETDRREEDRLRDLPSLIFGQVAAQTGGEEGKFAPRGLKRRASFDPALADAGSVQVEDFGSTILLGPKPSLRAAAG